MIEAPLSLIQAPERPRDPLSSILSLAHARSTVSGLLKAGGRWALSFPAPSDMKFNAVVRGSCWLIAGSEEAPIQLGPGDCFLLAAPQPYILCSAPDVTPVQASSVFAGDALKMATTGSGQDVTILGGQFKLELATAELLASLPPLLVVRSERLEAEQLLWLIGALASEVASGAPGSSLAASYLVQLVMIMVLRVHIQMVGPSATGWVRGLTDRRIAAALGAMHGRPAAPWHVQALALEAGMSRSSFAARFTELVGTSPLDYLLRWRLHLASVALADGSEPLGRIAAATGYGSESALANAFKRRYGVSPMTYRRLGAHRLMP